MSRSSLERREGFTCTANLLCNVLDGDKMSYSRNQLTPQAVLAF